MLKGKGSLPDVLSSDHKRHRRVTPSASEHHAPGYTPFDGLPPVYRVKRVPLVLGVASRSVHFSVSPRVGQGGEMIVAYRGGQRGWGVIA